MTTEDRHAWVTDRLSDYLDGGLDPAEAERVEAHLGTCPTCSAVRRDLEVLVSASRTLGPVDPPRDLWPGVAASLGGGTARSRARPTRAVLAAAAVVLVTVSASLAWWGRGVVVSAPAGPSVDVGSAAPVRAAGIRPGASLPATLATELQELESVLGVARDRLDPGTVEVLERNLLLIERAIEDSYQALAVDPENEFVRQHLERTYLRKRDMLREVSRLAELAG